MSFTDFKETTANNPGTTVRYGGNDLKEIMQILNGFVVANRRPKILNEWIWLDSFDVKAPAVAPAAPADINTNRVYTDPTDFKLKIKKTGGSIRELETIDITDAMIAASGITTKSKLPGSVAYEDEANIFTSNQRITKTAQAGVAEQFQRWDVSDDASANLLLWNYSSADGLFAPKWSSLVSNNSTLPGWQVFATIQDAADTGTSAVITYDARTVLNPIVSRTLFSLTNRGTAVLSITPTTFNFTNKQLINATIGTSVTGIADVNIAASGITTRSKLPGPVAYEDEANTFTLSQMVNRTAQASAAELIATFQVSDSAGGSKIEFLNASSADAVFSPWIRAYNLDTAAPGLFLYGYIGNSLDTGSDAGMRFDVRKADNSALTVRPLFSFRTGGTEIFAINQTNVAFGGKQLINATVGSSITGIVDANISAHTSTKITITNKALLPAAAAYEDEANIFTAAQRFNSYIDLDRITIPADPGANIGRFYVKQIDPDNDGVFVKLKKAGVISEVQIPV